MKDFRVKFKLDDDIAEKFSIVKDKPGFLSQAVKWYLTHGKESLERLAEIESMLTRGINQVEKHEVKKDEIDEVFGQFMV